MAYILYITWIMQLLAPLAMAVSDVEIYALFDLWNTTGGSEWVWTNTSACLDPTGHVCWHMFEGVDWRFSTPLNESEPCLPGSDRWRGVNCTEAGDHIAGLMIPNVGMNGTLPSTICDLSWLYTLSVQNNNLHGEVPECISKLTALEAIDLQRNMLSGEIPDSLWELTQLRWLAILSNRFSGQLSSGVGKMTNLLMLNLGANFLSGELPVELGNLERVRYAPIGRNYFTGSIPAEIANMNLLIHLGLLNCALTGQIPMSFASMTSLQSITLNNNLLSGTFPSHLMEIPSLLNIQLSGNRLEGSLPYFGEMSQLQVLQLQNNGLSGNLYEVFGRAATPMNISTLNTLDLSENLLSGSIPPEIFELPLLRNLALSTNCFTGTLPESVCDAWNMRFLSLNGLNSNRQCSDIRFPLLDLILGQYVHGTIPSCAWRLPQLVSIHLSGNRFRGNIGDITSSSTLTNLSISFNHFSGSLPVSVQRHSFDTIDVSYNVLTGMINEVKSVNGSLNAKLNRFSGRLSHSISDLAANEIRILRGNMFSCDYIPPEDDRSDTYICGSVNLNNALVFLFCSLLLFILLVLSVAMLIRFRHDTCVSSYTSNTYVDYFFFFEMLGSFNNDPPNIVKFEIMMRKATCFTVAICVIAAALFVPVYILKIGFGYSSYEHSYSWILSLAYSSGMWMGISVLLVWTMLVFFGLLHVRWNVPSANNDDDDQAESPSYDISPKLNDTEFRDNGLGMRNQYTLFGTTIVLMPKHILFLLLLLNVVVVLGANSMYVYLVLLDLPNSSMTAAQIGFALFTLCWKKMIASRLTYESDVTMSHRVMLRVLIDLFISVFAPFLVLSASDPDCFRDVFIRPESIESSYQYPQCLLFLPSGKCQQFVPLTTTLEPFLPPFIYNNGCSSQVIAAYVPVFLYLYTILIVIMPLSHYLLAKWAKYTRIPSLLRPVLPGVLWPQEWCGTSSGLRMNVRSSTASEIHSESPSVSTIASIGPRILLANVSCFFKPDLILSQFGQNIAILCTFGLSSPPLMLAVMTQTIVNYGMWRVWLGRFLTYKVREMSVTKTSMLPVGEGTCSGEDLVQAIQHDVYLQHIEKSLVDIEHAFELVTGPIVFCSACVVSFLTYDMVANDSSSSPFAATAIPVMALIVPCLALLVDKTAVRIHLRRRGIENKALL